MRKGLHRLAKRYLPDSTFKQLSRINQRLFGSSWVVSSSQASIRPEEELWALLSQLKVGSGADILVHSSAAQLAKIGVSAPKVIQILKELILPDGALLMPSFPFGGSFYEFIDTNPVFKINRTPSRMGLVTEIFRRDSDVVRSLHPTHPVCVTGKDAGWYVSEHHLDATPFGVHSPFSKLAARGGVVVGLGLQPDYCLTNVHVIEDRMGEQFPVRIYSDQRRRMEVIDQNGYSRQMEVPIHDREISRIRDVSILIKALRARKLITQVKYKTLECFMVYAQDINDTLLEMLQRGLTIYRTG